MNPNTLHVIFELEQSDLSEELEVVKKDNYQISDEVKEVELINDSLQPSRFVDPISVAVIITATYLIKRLTDFWLKDKERGVQIDVRNNPPTVSRIAGIPAGFLVIINKDGLVTTQKVEYEKNADLVELVSKTFNIK